MKTFFDSLANEKYISLQTIRKNGSTVSTPVWFVLKENKLFIRSSADSGKIKRIRNNNNVKISICNMKGNIRGHNYDAKANFEKNLDYQEINSLFDKKYGILSFLLKIFYKIKKIKLTILSITINSNSE
ncbi:MAG: PPOX class F420-dependent oxidoreductase [Nitrososphaeraceae archaeon]